MHTLSFAGLHYTYPETASRALDGVDLEISSGLTLLTGSSGSGKSTLLRVCNGLIPHFHGGVIGGSARVLGREVVRTPTRELAREVGFVFQDPELQAVYPSVERDPFALRRAAQGVVKILVEGKIDIDLAPLVNDGTAGAKALAEFLQDRIRYYFKEVRGFLYDEVNAATAAGWSNLVDLEARLIRIRDLRSSPDFEPLAASFKRIRNILDQQKFTGVNATAIDEKLLQDGPERDLYDEYRRIAGQPIESVVSQLRPKVDLFFDKVLVNAPEDDVRRNRLMLLGTLLLEFSNIADFSEIVTTS